MNLTLEHTPNRILTVAALRAILVDLPGDLPVVTINCDGTHLFIHARRADEPEVIQGSLNEGMNALAKPAFVIVTGNVADLSNSPLTRGE
jgi:hypothetical protein